MKVIEYLEGYYTAQEEPFGVAYKWSPERVVIECECGARPTLTSFASICSGCGIDHALSTRQELNGSREMTVEIRFSTLGVMLGTARTTGYPAKGA